MHFLGISFIVLSKEYQLVLFFTNVSKYMSLYWFVVLLSIFANHNIHASHVGFPFLLEGLGQNCIPSTPNALWKVTKTGFPFNEKKHKEKTPVV